VTQIFISDLRLTDFRSYRSLDLSLDSRPVVLFGPNGAGKTNLLEAVSFLAPGRGIRRARLDDIARRDGSLQTPAWGVAATLEQTDTDPLRISVGQVPENPRRRLLRLDGKNTTGAVLAGLVKILWLTPAQDRLFTGPAADRRKFLDRFTLSHSPSHGLSSLRYEKARAERNRLLSDGVTDAAWYDALETDMAARGAEIAQGRAQTITKLKTEIKARPQGAFPKADITLVGDAEMRFIAGDSLMSVEDYIREDLSANREQDMRAGRSLRGVHRSDLDVYYAAKSMPASDCSTGEQKALLIGLILAHARAQMAHCPFLLLDEVAAHLDSDRRAALIADLIDLPSQVFMTGTDASLFKAFDDQAQIFHVNNGVLLPQ